MPPEPLAERSEPALRLLYVDDDRINAFLFEQACEALGNLLAAVAATPEEAHALAQEGPLDALVLDLHLPGIDGCQLLSELRRHPGLADVPAVLCTAEPAETLSQRAAAAGFLEVWSKPAQAADLARLVAIIRGLPDDRVP